MTSASPAVGTLGPFRLGPSDTPENGVYTGDARELSETIPSQSVDLVIADPPYGIGYASSRTTRPNGQPRTYDNSFGEDSYQDDWLPEVGRILKTTGALYLFTRWDMIGRWGRAIEQAGLIIKQRIVWNKSHWKMGDLRFYGSQTEDILFSIMPDHRLRWDKRGGNLWTSSSSYLPEGQWNHPTQKAEAIIERMILNSTDPGGVVVDLHVGSGTTPSVCARLGRRWFCCDIKPKYVKMARDRIRDTQPPLPGLMAEQLELTP